jgi:glutamate--cysteine ligase
VEALATLLDEVNETTVHRKATRNQLAKLQDPELTPSAKVLRRMREMKTAYFRFAMNQSLANSDFFRARTLSPAALEAFGKMTSESIAAQHKIEASDTIDFATYLKNINQS